MSLLVSGEGQTGVGDKDTPDVCLHEVKSPFACMHACVCMWRGGVHVQSLSHSKLVANSACYISLEPSHQQLERMRQNLSVPPRGQMRKTHCKGNFQERRDMF